MNYYIKKARFNRAFFVSQNPGGFIFIERSISWIVATAFGLLAPVVTQFGGYIL
jgi:hypothetical protein